MNESVIISTRSMKAALTNCTIRYDSPFSGSFNVIFLCLCAKLVPVQGIKVSRCTRMRGEVSRSLMHHVCTHACSFW
jgi:hypothetical protein